jgi:hypothetical protein
MSPDERHVEFARHWSSAQNTDDLLETTNRDRV